MMAAVEVVADKSTRQLHAPSLGVTQKLIDGMLDRGLYSRAVLDCVCIAPPLITSDDDLDRIVNIVGETVEAVAAAVA